MVVAALKVFFVLFLLVTGIKKTHQGEAVKSLDRTFRARVSFN